MGRCDLGSTRLTPVEYGTKYSRVTPGQTRCSGAWTSDPSSVAATPIISAVLGRMIKFGVCRLGLDSRFVTSRTVPCTRQIHTTPRHAAPRDRRMQHADPTDRMPRPADRRGLTLASTLARPHTRLDSLHTRLDSRRVTSPDLSLLAAAAASADRDSRRDCTCGVGGRAAHQRIYSD